MDRIMVKASCLADGFKFWMFSRRDKFLGDMYVFRSTFEDLEERGYAIQHGNDCYAVFQRDYYRENVTAKFAWFSRSGKQLSGREETVTLDYEALMAFVRDSVEPDGPKEWRGLSVIPREVRPRLVFRCPDRIRQCLGNKLVRRKLVKFLRDNFKWPRTERIEFYSDFVPYSFFFQEFRGDTPVMCGGVILHGQDDMAKAYYSIHT